MGAGALRQGSIGRPARRLRWRRSLAIGVLICAGSIAQPGAQSATGAPALQDRTNGTAQADLTVLTYNVGALPWPVAQGRDQAARKIAARLADLRRAGDHPTIVVLQEAFTPEAKAIGDRAGYPYQVHGPSLRDSPGDPAGEWYRGETGGSALDSGLVILSDLPVTQVDRAAFPAGACSGYDCLAAKGVLLVAVAVPGRGEVAIATTHLNSRKASGAPYERTHEAYRRQTAFLSRFLAAHRPPSRPLIVAGDFNRGQRPVRIAALDGALIQLDPAGPREGLRAVMARDPDGFGLSKDAAWIRRKARDMQFLFDGGHMRIEAQAADIPFGTEADGSTLSDHLGFTVRYRLSRNDKTA